MKSRKQFYTFTIIWILFLMVFPYISVPKVDIKRVLNKSDYSYLPIEAKNYIEKVYEISGEIPYTEKNKKENVPYLNPKYIEYLTLSTEEQEKIEEIPDVYRLDYSYNSISGEGLPSTYDLRNVSGKNYITPLKNQQTLDLCWAFTSVEQAESLLLKKSGTSYSSSSVVLSPRQMDYVTSQDGVYNYHNPYGSRLLTSGGNFFMSSIAMANGVTLRREEDMPFDLNEDLRYYSDVFQKKDNQYEVLNTVMIPSLTDVTDTTLLNNYVSNVKSYIMNYGGAYVATQAPNASCATTNTDNSTILRVDDRCVEDSNHAMQIIGWDDNYQYKYCASGSAHSKYTSSCSNVVSGKGAWLVRNSWGTAYSYIYLAYDSDNYDVRLTTEISPLSDEDWDNNYFNEFEQYYILTSSSNTQFFEKKINTPEKLEKIKFYSYGSNGQYTISVTSEDHSYRGIKNITVPNPGVITVDLSDLDIILNGNNFNIELLGRNGVYFVRGSISAFTSNVEDTLAMKTNDINVTSNGVNYAFDLFTHTKNISSGSNISYSLLNSSNVDVSSYLTVSHNGVGFNGVNAQAVISSSVPAGTYTLVTHYGNVDATSKINIGQVMNLSGNGTVSNPYQINTEADLKKIANSLNSHYKLMKDITLTENWVPIGTKEFPFSGSFDGNGHKIINLVVDGEYENSGLFGTVVSATGNTTSFKKITFVNPNINGRGDSGALIGTIMGPSSTNEILYSTITIQDISILDGGVYSYYKNAGALIGSITSPVNDALGIHTYNIQRIYSSASIAGVLSTGMIGYINGTTFEEETVTVNMTDIENTGWIDIPTIRNGKGLFFNGTHGTIVGYALNYVDLNIRQYVSTSLFRGYSNYSSDGVIGVYNADVDVVKEKGYSIINSTLSVMKNTTSYSSWSNFSSNWDMKVQNGSSYVPMLKNVPVTYTNLSDVTLQPGEEITLSSFYSKSTLANVRFTTENPSTSGIVQITPIKDSITGKQYDARIKALAVGEVNISVTNLFDGYLKNLKVTVQVPEPEYSDVYYYKNDGTSGVAYDRVLYQEKFNLMKNSFVRDHYVFLGWNTQADGSGVHYDEEAELLAEQKNYSFYAEWRVYRYTIHYNANGGVGNVEDTNANYGDVVHLRKNEFTKDDYVFAGWNTQADGKGTNYVDLENVTNLVSTDEGEITLYAQWKKSITGFEILEYSVDYDILYIDDIKIGTSLRDYKTHFILGDGYTITIDLGEKTKIYTGSTIKLYYNGELVSEYTNIVRGDINGDGDVNSGDLFRMRQHMLNVLPVTGVYFKAADTNKNGEVNSGDLFRLRQHLLGVLLLP